MEKRKKKRAPQKVFKILTILRDCFFIALSDKHFSAECDNERGHNYAHAHCRPGWCSFANLSPLLNSLRKQHADYLMIAHFIFLAEILNSYALRERTRLPAPSRQPLQCVTEQKDLCSSHYATVCDCKRCERNFSGEESNVTKCENMSLWWGNTLQRNMTKC